MLIEVFLRYAAISLYFMLYIICIYLVAYFCRFLYVNKFSLYIKKKLYLMQAKSHGNKILDSFIQMYFLNNGNLVFQLNSLLLLHNTNIMIIC